jgi:sulfide:quinone oxidoreductase
VDPVAATVRCSDGTVIAYRDVVVACGLVPDEAALGGVDAALATPTVGSNYLDRAEQTWCAVQATPRGGRAVFTVPRPPVSCTGTTLKPLFLAATYWRRERRDIDITLIVDRAGFVGVPAIDDTLRRHLEALDVTVRHRTAVTALQPDERFLTVRDHGGLESRLEYDMLHLVPPFRGPSWIEASGLSAAGSHGLVDVDPRTLRHHAYDSVWAIGDCASLDTDSSGGALRKQTAVLVDNVLAARRGSAMSEYSGYTVAPITTGAHRLLFGEFERDGRLTS